MKQINLFNDLIVNVSDDDWTFLCKYRFFTENPKKDEIQAEFVTGTGITLNRKHLWDEADKRFVDYIADLRDILGVDNDESAEFDNN